MFAILDAEALKAKGNGKGHQTRPEACKPKADSASASASALCLPPPSTLFLCATSCTPLTLSLYVCLCCMPLENSFMLKCANLLSTLYASCCLVTSAWATYKIPANPQTASLSLSHSPLNSLPISLSLSLSLPLFCVGQRFVHLFLVEFMALIT